MWSYLKAPLGWLEASKATENKQTLNNFHQWQNESIADL